MFIEILEAFDFEPGGLVKTRRVQGLDLGLARGLQFSSDGALDGCLQS